MATFNSKRLEAVQQLHRELASENRLHPEQARAFVRGLQIDWNVPPIEWSTSESQDQLVNARRLMHAAELFEELNGPKSSEAQDCYRRAAEILEWLTRAKDTLRQIAPIELFAAAAFQLSGLPAMASGLLNQLEEPDPGTRLYANFLKADFDGVINEVLAFWEKHPELTTRNAPASLLSNDEEETFEWYFTSELIRSIGLIAASLRQGDDGRLQSGLQKLRALDRMATRCFSDDIALLATLMRAVADRYESTSIYKPIRKLAEFNPSRGLRLNRFARDQFSRGRGILWTSQIRGLDRLVESTSFALCTPTGSGKTLVANLALIKELLLAPEGDMAPLALYLVPSRALAGEVEAKLTSELGADLIVTGLYGGTDWGITDYWLNAETPTVLIATVEKADALMRYIGPLLVRRLRLLIVDEAHQVVPGDVERAGEDFAQHRSRSLRLESFVSRLLARAPDIARIALTAVAGGAAAPVAKWIEGNSDAVPIGTNYRSTRQVIGALEATPDKASIISLRLMNGAPLAVRARGSEVYIPLRVPPMPALPTDMRNSLACYNEVNVLWTALHLIDGERRVLISVAQEPELTMGRFKKALALPSWNGACQFTPPAEPSLRSLFDKARATSIDYCGPDSYEVALLDSGIASNHGQMPQRLRRLMTELIDKKICPITIATATLTEGVNLPFDLIFVTSLKRRSFTKTPNGRGQQKIVPLSTSEFRNLAGRAGRPGATQSMEGMTLVALPMAPSTTADKTKVTQRGQVSSFQQDYRNLLAALEAEDRPGANVASPLTLLLGLIAEKAASILRLRGDAFLGWLESVSPEDISSETGIASSDPAAILADSIDELDSVILSAIEEVSADRNAQLNRTETETLLKRLWECSFSRVAAVQEQELEQAFVRRGRGLTESVYKDPAERRRLYQYGFAPHVGRRFEEIAPSVHLILESAEGYGYATAEDQFAFFAQLGTLVAADRGFGFRARDTISDNTLLANWQGTLRWWVGLPGAESPAPADLRNWQRFVAENFEFRLGVVVGAVVAQAWSNGAENSLDVPSLDRWRETTGLPWFGFWARELLRWGTLDPFIAFALAQGLAGTRREAADLKREFVAWMQIDEEPEADDWIDPQLFLRWTRSRQDAGAESRRKSRSFDVKLSGVSGKLDRYSVLPIRRADALHWLDPAGFELARSEVSKHSFPSAHRDDFELRKKDGEWSVRHVFRSH